MTQEEKAARSAIKQAAIHAHKECAIACMKLTFGFRIKMRTMTVLINPDTKTADNFSFIGYHDRIGWNSEPMQTGYVRRVRYD